LCALHASSILAGVTHHSLTAALQPAP